MQIPSINDNEVDLLKKLVENTASGGGGGGGAVSSVNGQTGAVVLTPPDVGAALVDGSTDSDFAIRNLSLASGNGGVITISGDSPAILNESSSISIQQPKDAQIIIKLPAGSRDAAFALNEILEIDSVLQNTASASQFEDMPLNAGQLASFRFVLYCVPDATGGIKIAVDFRDVGGTPGAGTVNFIVSNFVGIDNSTGLINKSGKVSTNNADFSFVVGATDLFIIIEGSISTISSGVLTLDAAKSVNAGGDTTLQAGSYAMLNLAS